MGLLIYAFTTSGCISITYFSRTCFAYMSMFDAVVNPVAKADVDIAKTITVASNNDNNLLIKTILSIPKYINSCSVYDSLIPIGLTFFCFYNSNQ